MGGSLLRPRATEESVLALERRLGVELPPSYRAFLLLSDGASAQPGLGVMHSGQGLLGVAAVGWFREREPDYSEIWTSDDDG